MIRPDLSLPIPEHIGAAHSVAVLGMGLMGSAIGRALLAAGHRVTVWNRSASRCAPLVDEGATHAATVDEAFAQADILVLILLDYNAARITLQNTTNGFAGKTIVNLITGTPAEAVEFAEWVQQHGGRYLDGIIAAYPADIGKAGTLIYLSGSADVWTEHASLLIDLAGAATFVGTSVGAANVMDAAMTAAFYDVSIGAFLEALSFAVTSRVDLAEIKRTLDYWVALLGQELHAALDAVESGDHANDQATLDTYLAGMRSCRVAMLDAGERAHLLSAAIYNLELAHHAGLGDEGISGQVKTARARPRPLRHRAV